MESGREQETVNLIGDDGTSNWSRCVMSESASSVATPPKPADTRSEAADKQAFAQVEKWMAIIREVSRERPGR